MRRFAERSFEVNARTLIITAGAIVALAAPTVANARMLPVKQPSKHFVKKHAAKQHVTKRQGQSRQIYIYAPGPVVQVEPSLQQLEQDYNNDLIAHGLDPIDFGTSSPAAAPESPSSDVASQAPEASLAAAASTTASETVASTATDDADLCD
jgi:hypothetical protein